MTNKKVLQALIRGRVRHDNAMLAFESAWAKLKPTDYKLRSKIIRAALDMVKIDQDLKVWESKVK